MEMREWWDSQIQQAVRKTHKKTNTQGIAKLGDCCGLYLRTVPVLRKVEPLSPIELVGRHGPHQRNVITPGTACGHAFTGPKTHTANIV